MSARRHSVPISGRQTQFSEMFLLSRHHNIESNDNEIRFNQKLTLNILLKGRHYVASWMRARLLAVPSSEK